MKSFNVIIHDFNGKDFKKYDIMPYLIREWNNLKGEWKKDALKDVAKWVDKRLMYQYWSRCEYEFLLLPWPYSTKDSNKKVDIYWQCKMNMPLIVDIFKENVKLK